MTDRLKLSKTVVKRILAPGPGKRATYCDVKVPKFALRVTAAGSKTFDVIKRSARDMVWYKLGTFPDLTVELAQKKAESALGVFAIEENPAAARRAARGMPTLSELFMEYGERHGKKKRALRDDGQRFRT